MKKTIILLLLSFTVLSCREVLSEDIENLLNGENIILREVYSLGEYEVVIILKNGRGYSGDCEIAIFSDDKELITHKSDRIRSNRTNIAIEMGYFIFEGYDLLYIFDSDQGVLQQIEKRGSIYSLFIDGDYLFFPSEYQSFKRVNLNTFEVFEYPLVETGGGYVYLINNEIYLWYFGPIVYKVSGDDLIKVDPSIIDGHEKIESEILGTTDSEIMREYEQFLGIKRYRE